MFQVWSFGALLKFFILPLLVMHATLSTTNKEVTGGTGGTYEFSQSLCMSIGDGQRYAAQWLFECQAEGVAKKERKSPSMTMRKSPSMTSLLGPETAGLGSESDLFPVFLRPMIDPDCLP